MQQGIRNAIRELKKTPVVADIVEYVEDVRRGNKRKVEDVNARQVFSNAVRCTECNDHGFVNVVYPSSDEAIRPCDCETGRSMFGDGVFKLVEMDLPLWKQKMYFGEKNPKAFHTIRVSKVQVPTGEKYKGSDGAMHDRVKYSFVPYKNFGRPKEEVYVMYVAR